MQKTRPNPNEIADRISVDLDWRRARDYNKHEDIGELNVQGIEEAIIDENLPKFYKLLNKLKEEELDILDWGIDLFARNGDPENFAYGCSTKYDAYNIIYSYREIIKKIEKEEENNERK